ncbi:hypothetical protein ACFE04_029637 [Oxalis oulophora]
MSPPKTPKSSKSEKKGKKSNIRSGHPQPQPQPAAPPRNLEPYLNTDFTISEGMTAADFVSFLGKFRERLRATPHVIEGHEFLLLRRFKNIKENELPSALFATVRVFFTNRENVEKSVIYVFATWDVYLVGLIFSNIIVRIGEPTMERFDLDRIPIKGNSTNWVEIRDFMPDFLDKPSYAKIMMEAGIAENNLTFGMDLLSESIDLVFNFVAEIQNHSLNKNARARIASLVLQGVVSISEASRYACLEQIFCHQFHFYKRNPVQGYVFKLLQNWSKLCKSLLTNVWAFPFLTYPRIVNEDEPIRDWIDEVDIVSIEVIKGVVIVVLASAADA